MFDKVGVGLAVGRAMSTSNYEDPRPCPRILRFFEDEVCLFLKFEDEVRTRRVFCMIFKDF